jgi:hypothetical protein
MYFHKQRAQKIFKIASAFYLDLARERIKRSLLILNASVTLFYGQHDVARELRVERAWSKQSNYIRLATFSYPRIL